MKITHVQTARGVEDFDIEIEKGEDTKAAAQELSRFIAGLDLEPEVNDRLVELMVEQVNVAQRDAFFQGVEFGRDLGRWEAENED